MTNGEAVNWIINIMSDIGKAEHQELWHYEQALAEIREMLESTQPKQHWIPCSERLPDSMGWDKCYLVSLAWGGVGAMEYKSTGFHNYGSLSPVSIETVIAWMPLPEPYKAERREDG